MLEHHGDDALRAAIELTVARGHLTVNGVRRALPLSARESDGASRRSRAAQPRGRSRGSSRRAHHRAELRGGEA
jgi:hypothetical protein